MNHHTGIIPPPYSRLSGILAHVHGDGRELRLHRHPTLGWQPMLWWPPGTERALEDPRWFSSEEIEGMAGALRNAQAKQERTTG